MTLSLQEQETLVSLLKKLEPGYLPKEIFFEMCRLTVQPAYEIVPLRKGEGGKLEVLLIQRPSDDPHWGGKWHTPGSIIISSDTDGSLEDSKQRVLEELGLEGQDVYLVFTSVELRKWKRGTALSIYHYLEVEGEMPVGRFFPVDQLPEEMIENQTELLSLVVDAYHKNTTIQ